MFSILYVDDEPGLLEIGKLFLESAGDFSVTTVLSGKQAIDKLGQQDFDAIISDYQMPEMNGIEFLKRVRQSFGSSPFILFTGRGREEVVIEAINNGVDFYLQKGGEPQAQFAELAHKVRQAVSRKRAETALSDSERRLADIIDFLPDATFAIDTKGTVIAWNRAMERMTGVASLGILGKGDYEYAIPFYHERRPLLINLVLENDPAIAEKYPFVKNEGGNLVSEITIPHFNGGKGAALWFTASPLYDRKGEIVGAIESIREITERKKAEEALNESERRFRELADLLPQGIYEANTDGRMTYVNRIALEMSGYTADEVKSGLNALEVIAPEDRPRAFALFTRMVKTGDRGQGSAEYLAVRKDGSIFPVSIYSSPIYRDGRITGIRGVIIDITEQKKAEERLVSANREYTNLLDQIQDIYYFSDTGGRLVRASRSMATLLGYDDISECIGRNIAEDFYANPQDRKRLIEELNRNGQVTGFEVLLKKKDGTTVLIEASSHLSYDQEGNVTGIEGTFRDITERKRAEEELRAANEQLQASEEELREQYDEMAASEQRIRESEERYRTVFETTGTAMLIIEDDAAISLANAEFSRMSGFSREEIENRKKWPEFVLGEDRERMLAQHRERRTDPEKALHRYEFRFLTRSGAIRYIDLTIDIIPGTKKSVASLLDITERRKAEEELRAANEQLQASEEELRQQYDELARAEDALRFLKISVDQSADEVFWLDFDGKILYVNDAACRINGYPRDEFLNMTIFDMNPDLTPEIWAGSVADLRQKKTQLFTTRHLRKDGNTADVEIMSVYVRKGDEEYSFAFVRDITSRTRAEGELKAAYEQVTAAEEELRKQYDELARAEKNFRNLVDNAPDPIYIQTNTRFRYLNNAALALLGASSADELLGTSMWDRIDPSFHEVIKKRVSSLTFDILPVGLLEEIYLKMDGTPVDVEVKAIPFQHEGENGVLVMLHDISARKKAEADLRTAYEQLIVSEEELRQQYDTLAAAEAEISSRRRQLEEVAANVPGVVYQFYARPDGSRGMYFAGSRAREILGLEPDLERFFPEFTSRVHPDDRARFIASIDDAINKKSDWHFEGRLFKGSGETIWFEGRSTPVAHGSELVFSGVLLDITSRKTMEAAVRESEEKYRSLVDLSPVAVIVHRDGKVLYANPEALRLAGAEREEDVVGRELASFIHPDDQAMAAEDFRLLAEEGKTIPLKEERLVRLNGEPFTVEITAMPIHYHGTGAFLAVFRDITKRKQAEAALAESERKYRTVFETAEEGIWIVDTGFRTVSVNRKMQALFGYTEEEMRGRPVWDFVPPDEAESMKQELSRRPQGEPGRYERRWVRKDGTEIWCLTSGTPLFSPGGEFLGSFGMFTDTTERRQIEDALRESEKKYRSLVENIPFGITLIDADHRIVMSNAAQGQMFHTDAGLWPGRYCYHEFEKRDTVCAHCPGTRAMATGACHVVETEGVRDDGTRFNARIHAIPLPDAEGKATRFIEVVEDITERKMAEDALRQNEEKYRTLIETTGTGFVILDEDGRVLDANPEYVRLTGHSRLEEIAGRSVIEWTAEHELERNAEAVRQCLRDGFIRNFEIDYTAGDGTVLPIEINATVLNSKGSPQILTLCRDISDRRKAQDTLKTSAEDYQTILRTAMDGFCIIALDGSFIDVNDAFCMTLEYTRDEALALSLGDVEVRETAEETSRHIENIVRNGYDRFETRWQKKGGGTIDVEVSVLYTGTHGGRFITFSRNITEQKRAESALRESEEKYRTLVESSFDGILIHQDGVVVYINRTGARFYGSDDPGVFIGKKALELIAPEFRQRVADRIREAPERPLGLMHEQLIRLDGTVFDADVTTTPTTWKGKPAAYVTFRDISAQKKTEEALRESEDKYRMLVEKSRDGVFIIQDGRLVFYNRALAGLTGYTAEELDGTLLSDLIAPEDREMVVSRARDRAAGRQVPELYELSLLHKDGISRTRIRVRAGPGTYKGRPASIGMFYDVTEERKREEALRESEAKFRELTELLPQIVFEMDRNLMITFVNRQAYKVLGYTPDDVAAGFNALSIIDPSQHARVRHNIGKLVKKEPYEHTEYTIFRKDGSSFPALIYADPMLKSGELTGFRGIIIDISIRKQAEDALRASEEKYRTLVEVNRDIIYSLDSKGTILYVSPQTISQLGYRPDEMEGHDFKEFIHPDDIPSMVLHIQESISAKKPAISDQFRVRKKDGSYRWFEDKTIVATDSQGRHIVAGTIRDITEEKAAQDALRESEEKFRALVETTIDFIWEVDASGVYTYVSPQVRQILGYEPEELLGKTPFDFMPPDEAEKVAAAFNGFVMSRLPIVALENKTRKKDGSVVILETSGVVRNAKDGSFLGYRGIDRDITTRKLAEEALLEKTEELNRFFTTSLDLFCIADTGGYFRRLNHEWEKSLGYTLAELEGHRFIDFVHPEDLEPTLAAIADLDKQQEVLDFTNRYRHKDGTYRWIEWRSLPVGNLIFAAARDITARHDAAERTARLSALKQDLLRTAPLEEKLKRITDAVVNIFGADFARIWITGPGDLCKKGCIHAEVFEGDHVCRNRASCLHLMVSSGRYTHTDGSHRRVPFGAYKIGMIATGDIKQFITNDVTHDPRVHDHAWAESLGLVSFSGFRLVSPDGNPVGVLAFFGCKPVIPEVRDDLDDLATTTSQVVQMHRAEQALRESEARLSSILHGSPVLQFVIDRNHRVISWNNALEEYSGIRAADIIGTDEQWRAFYPDKRPVLADLLVNGNPDAITRLYAGKLRKSRYVEGAIEATDFFPHMGSSGIWLSFTAAPIRDVQGTIIGAIETLEDVTERINAEKALRESEQWTRTILNTAQAGIILVDAADHQIVDANKKALELIGLDREHVIGATCHRFICPAEKEKCPVTDLGQKVNTSERILLTAAGLQVPVLKTVVPAVIGGRDVLVESFVDISEQKRAEAAIRETNRKLNLLNSITRHDIRNQILVAQGYTQLAILNKPDPVVTDFLIKTAAVIETIQRQIDFTREYQEMGVQAPAWFEVGTVIRRVRPETVALRNTCNTAVEIFADPMIDKVFYNLFDNAVKHGIHVTTVTVRCEEKEDGLSITFADNGCGIPFDEKQKIFEKGYGKNTGLGLFLVREILAITGITIHETGTPGRGAVFEIIVPAGAYRKTG